MIESIIKLKPYDNSDWLEDLKSRLKQFSTCDSVVLQWHSKYTIEIINVISQIRSIKSAPLIR